MTTLLRIPAATLAGLGLGKSPTAAEVVARVQELDSQESPEDAAFYAVFPEARSGAIAHQGEARTTTAPASPPVATASPDDDELYDSVFGRSHGARPAPASLTGGHRASPDDDDELYDSVFGRSRDA